MKENALLKFKIRMPEVDALVCVGGAVPGLALAAGAFILPVGPTNSTLAAPDS